MSKRVQQKQDRKARIEAMRAQARREERRRRLIWFGGGGVLIAGVVVGVVIAVVSSSHGGVTTSSEVIPAAVTGQTTVQAPAVAAPNTTGISGVTAYDTAGYPAGSSNGPASGALSHEHVPGPVQYSVNPPVGGQHNTEWMTCGVYDKPVPSERAVHNLEHGAVWITYQPSLSSSEVSQLRAFFDRQSVLSPADSAGSRYIDLTPYPGLAAPIMVSSWGFQLRLNSPADPRLQQFVDKFRDSRKYTPEYGSPCTVGLGTPLQQ
jgi:Protein of unknown function (DUF3105)